MGRSRNWSRCGRCSARWAFRRSAGRSSTVSARAWLGYKPRSKGRKGGCMTRSGWIALVVAALFVGASAGRTSLQGVERQKFTADDYVEILQVYSEYVQGVDGIAM